jgi:hypothetical protein
MTKIRHIKARKKRTWTNLRVEIKELSEKLNISKEDFSQVNINQWKEIESKIWEKFSTNRNSGWIWETLRDSYSTMEFDYEKLKLSELIDSTERFWILLNETVNEKDKFWVYEGNIKGFDKVFWESGLTDEIIIVSKKYEWILIINHHDIFIGTGKIKDRIEKIKVGNTVYN